VKRIPFGAALASIIVLNAALMLVSTVLIGRGRAGVAASVEFLWIGGLTYSIFATMLSVAALIANDERFQLLGLQRDASDLRSMGWQDFERLVAQILEKQGHSVRRRGGPNPDGGVDLEFADATGTCIVQCKKWHWQLVGVGNIRELFGVMHAEGAVKSMFITAGLFSPEAVRFAEGKPIELLDGHKVWRMVRDLRGREPGEDDVLCPKCQSPMALRGSPKIWGCTRYPTCKGWRRARAGDAPR
jgi:restriction system protein